VSVGRKARTPSLGARTVRTCRMWQSSPTSKKPVVFDELGAEVDWANPASGGAFRKTPRTLAGLVKTLWEWVETNPADAKAFTRFAHQNTRKRQSGKGVGVAA